MRRVFELLSLAMLLMLTSAQLVAQSQSPIDGVDARTDPSVLAKQLGNGDPHVRQRSAEALAKLAATSQRRIVEGYQLQEKNKEVRLALNWALYRMGRSEVLFRIIEDLDSGRQLQAVSYLSELENPDLLYPFLKRQNNPPRMTAGLVKSLARNGDATTLDLIKPYRESRQPFVAEAAEIAHDEIEKRLGESAEAPERVRPRTVAKP
jgi:hypothetical protein